jgi:hypothetical protein
MALRLDATDPCSPIASGLEQGNGASYVVEARQRPEPLGSSVTD